jgi:hypothetical protein
MPAAKLPIADFRTQSQWHTYLGKLTPAQLKKVAATLNRILRIEFRLNTKKPAAELVEDIKKLYSVNNATKLLEIVKGIDADELPQPSQNIPKPTKKQASMGSEKDISLNVKKYNSLLKKYTNLVAKARNIATAYGKEESSFSGRGRVSGVRFNDLKNQTEYEKTNILANKTLIELRQIKSYLVDKLNYPSKNLTIIPVY